MVAKMPEEKAQNIARQGFTFIETLTGLINELFKVAKLEAKLAIKSYRLWVILTLSVILVLSCMWLSLTFIAILWMWQQQIDLLYIALIILFSNLLLIGCLLIGISIQWNNMQFKVTRKHLKKLIMSE